MGLYMNKSDHPDVYKNKKNVSTSNQEYVRRNFLNDLLNEQQKTNHALSETINELKSQYKQYKKIQNTKWKSVNRKIHYLKKRNQQHTETDNKILQQLDTLDEKSTDLITLLAESILKQINHLTQSNKEISNRIEKTEADKEQLFMGLTEQRVFQKEVIDRLANHEEIQKAVIEKLSHQEEFQTEVLRRLDSQEALTEKIFRQINHIRSILFERTNDLATKIEDGYKLTSTYVYKLMTGSDQPMTFTMITDKKKKEENI
ncbi:MAG: hypothetical protein WAM95_04880 [Bacillus sp. (in: firmicutes)]